MQGITATMNNAQNVNNQLNVNTRRMQLRPRCLFEVTPEDHLQIQQSHQEEMQNMKNEFHDRYIVVRKLETNNCCWYESQ